MVVPVNHLTSDMEIATFRLGELNYYSAGFTDLLGIGLPISFYSCK